MATALKPEDLKSFRASLIGLRARLQGDLSQLTDEALGGGQSDNSGNLSHVPLHLADAGTDNFEQEFDLSLIENEQETLHQVEEALGRIDSGTYGQCEECAGMVAKPRLQALPYTRLCIDCARAMESRG